MKTLKEFYSIARWKRELLAQVLILITTLMILSHSWIAWTTAGAIVLACLVIDHQRRMNEFREESEELRKKYGLKR